jgi:predicted transcriptional regulator
MIPFDIRPVRNPKPKKEVVSVRFDAETYKRLCQYARNREQILSKVMHDAVVKLLDGSKKA